MDDRTLEDAKDLLFEALELDERGRTALLDERCADRPRLREQVESLLAAHARSPAMLTGDGARPFAPPSSGHLAPGAHLGPYRIVREAGAGGFGTVYEAEQERPVRRRVALKVLHRGLDAPEARARFEAERQALARMDHPHIARVYDAGTTPEGRPWFAMEYVEGLPLSEFATERDLAPEQRLALFRQVCLAIQHAHQKGVVHRDLKPSNVLVGEVDGAPAPKVIDFGVAKAVEGQLTPEAVLTVDGQWLGTPAYMSPEQAAGEADVDTRSDVYGLGVLLYELLTRRPPFEFQGAGIVTLLETIAHVEPRRPSEVAPRGVRVPPDLDWIVLRCLEKDRARRYPSAQALADDVQRFLAGLPVEAAPPSTWYRLVKLTRRHSLAVGAAATVALALAIGGVGTAVGWMRAADANERLGEALELAERQAEVARAVNDFVNLDLLSSAVPSVEPGKGRDVPLRAVLDAASARIEGSGDVGGRFADKPLVEASVRAMLGRVYGKLGEYPTAEPHLRRALELSETWRGPDDPETRVLRVDLSANERMLGHTDAAQAQLERALAAQREQLGDADEETLISEWQLGLLRSEQGRPEEAFVLIEGVWERLLRTGRTESDLGAAVRGGMAIAAHQSGRDATAEEAFRDSHRLFLALRGPEDPETISALVNLAAFLRSLRRFAEAETLLSEAHADMARVLGPAHPSTLVALYNLGAVSLERGRGEEAEARLRAALEGQRATLGPDHAHVLSTEGALARSLELQGRVAEAESMLRGTLERCERALGPDHPITEGRRRDLALTLEHDPERTEELFALLDESLRSQQRAFGDAHPATLRAATNLARLLEREGDHVSAEEILVDTLERARVALGPEHLETLEIQFELAGVLLALERPREALELAAFVLEVGDRRLPPDDYDLARARLRVGLALHACGRRDEGRPLVERAREALLAARGPEDAAARHAAEALADW